MAMPVFTPDIQTTSPIWLFPMYLQDQERRTQQRNTASSFADDDRVLSFAQWIELNGISPATGRRILAGGKGPKILRLSDRRIGIRVRDNREWQDTLAVEST
jgi:hypothetical protein